MDSKFTEVFFTEQKRLSSPFLLFFSFVLSSFLFYVFFKTVGPAANSPSMYGDSNHDYIFEYICEYDLYSNNYSNTEVEIRYGALIEKANYYIAHDLQLKNLEIINYSNLYQFTQSSSSPLSLREKEEALGRWFAYLGDKFTSPLADYRSFTKRALSTEDELTRVFCLLYAYDNTYNISHYEGNFYFGPFDGESLSDNILSQQFAKNYNYNLNFKTKSHLPARTYVLTEKIIFCISSSVLFMFGFMVCFKKSDTKKSNELIIVTPLGKYKLAKTHLLLSLALSFLGLFAVWCGWLFSGIGFVKFINCDLYSAQVLRYIPKPFFNIPLWSFGLIQSGIFLIVIFSFCLFSFCLSNIVRNKALCFFCELILYVANLFVLFYYFWDYKKIFIPSSKQPVGYIANFTFDHSLITDFFILVLIIIITIIATLISYRIKPFKLGKKGEKHAGI